MHLQAILPDTISGLPGLEDTLGDTISDLVGAFLVASIILIMTALAGPWTGRKITAAFTDCIAIGRVGPFDLLTIIMNMVRLPSKKLIVPGGVDHLTWDLAPIVIPSSTLFGFIVTLMGNGIQLVNLETGLAFTFAATSTASLGIITADYVSSNKFSLIGVLHAVTVNITYETPLVVTATSVIIFAGPLRMSEIIVVQAESLFSVTGVTIPTWFAFVNLFAFVLFVIASLAEVGRNPFGIPGAPTEIVAGYQTEYSSVYFVFIYLGEFIHIFLDSTVAAILFFGSPVNPVLPGFVWFAIRIWAFFLFIQWVRSIVPHLRVDQFPKIGWKGMLVLSFANLVLTAIIMEMTT